MKSKIIRYLSGFLILVLILAAIIVSKTALFIISVLFIIFTLKEYREMFKSKDIEIFKFIPELIGALLSYLFIFDYQSWVTPVLVFGIFLTCFCTIIKNKKPYILVSFSTIMSFVYIFCTLYIIKLFYVVPFSNIKLVMIYFAAVLLGDFTASKIGPYFKNKHLSPEISPNKTIMGSVSNLAVSCIVCCFLYPMFKIWQCLLFGAVISIFSQIGDLTVSFIKRDLGLKHSSNLFFDYGGILDRVDAFIFSAPFAYYCLLFITYLLK